MCFSELKCPIREGVRVREREIHFRVYTEALRRHQAFALAPVPGSRLESACRDAR